MKSKQIATYSLMIALCLILTYVEVLIPFNFAIPGVKLGLSNIVVLYALYNMDIKSAFCINLLRILLAGFLFANPITITYSLCGGFLSLFAMILIKKVQCLSLISISITGALFHNIGQIIAAYFYLGSDKIIYYLPFLLVSGLITGLLTGIIGAIVVERTSNI
ncbi:MAG: Gx transporter family protein [Clostridia bacterium]